MSTHVIILLKGPSECLEPRWASAPVGEWVGTLRHNEGIASPSPLLTAIFVDLLSRYVRWARPASAPVDFSSGGHAAAQ